MSFLKITTQARAEIEDRKNKIGSLLHFGIDALNDALRGIFPDDLILIGAPSGLGKTQLCCNIAVANMENGKRVHYIALEASEFEIAQRLKFKMVMDYFFSDPNRPKIQNVNFSDWLAGKYFGPFDEYEEQAAVYFEKSYENLFLFSKGSKFGLAELIHSVCIDSEPADLIIIDHVHYFDLDDDDENRAMKQITKTVRDLAIEEKKPIVLIAHLRKKDRGNTDLCAGMEEFHGSSDLFKIATRVVTMAPGQPTEDGGYVTYFRIPKNRIDGGVTRFLFKTIFDPKIGGYRNGYRVGWTGGKEFKEIERTAYPGWAALPGYGSDGDQLSTRGQRPYADD